MEPTTEQLRAVVALLVLDAGAPAHYQALRAVVALARQYPVRLTGELAALNIMVDLWQDNRPGYDGMMALIERKRADRGMDPLEEPEDDRFDKAAYMRDFMREKRARTTRAAEIENRARGDREPLRGPARLEFQRVQAARWNEELQRRMETAREAHGGKRLPRETMEAVRTQFWAWVDQQLDEAERKARAGKR